MKRPNFKKEKAILKKGFGAAVGIDEAGRGPLAGPVTAAAILISAAAIRNSQSEMREKIGNIKDSKKLSPKKREEFYKILVRHPGIHWAAASVGPKIIDRINIARAADLAAKRAAEKLKIKPGSSSFILLDGGLRLPGNFRQEAIIKGDEKVWSIAAASVIAKVTRDRMMTRLAGKYPYWRFDVHKGYGTKLHYRLLRKFGPSKIHRRTFLRKFNNSLTRAPKS